MFNTVDAHAFVHGLGTNFSPLRLNGIRQTVEDEFLFDFVPLSMVEQPFSVMVRWEKKPRIFSLFLVAGTLVPAARYAWAIKAVNDTFNTADCNCIAKVSVIEPESDEEFIDLAFSWTMKFPDANALSYKGIKTLRWLVREQMVRFAAEATDIVDALLGAYKEVQTH